MDGGGRAGARGRQKGRACRLDDVADRPAPRRGHAPWMVESIPWIREIFQEPARLEDGYLVVSNSPGAGTAIKPEFLDRYAIYLPLFFFEPRSDLSTRRPLMYLCRTLEIRVW